MRRSLSFLWCLSPFLLLLSVFSARPVWAQAALGNPQPGSYQSGIGVISGWVCEARQIEIEFDNDAANRWQAGYGTRRTDTQRVCGDSNNGFGLLFNWNLLGSGPHTVRAFADGVEFAHATVTVTTLGTEFLRGASREATLPNFPQAGTDIVLRWQEAQQNFVISALIPYPTERGPRRLICEEEVVIEEARIIDADTLTLCEERVRLVGIDAPETWPEQQLCLNADGLCYPCGQNATDALKGKIGADNRLSCYLEPELDRYGRALGVCFSSDGTDLNGWLVATGHAVAYLSDTYMPHQEIAIVEQRGVHAGEFIDPSEWRRGARLERCEG